MADRCKIIVPNNFLDELLYKKFTSIIRSGYIEIGEEKICMSKEYMKIADDVENFEFQDSDIIVASHAKAGTTWTQEMVWMICKNLDFEGGKIDLNIRFPFLEFSGVSDFPKVVPSNVDKTSLGWFLDSVNFTKNQVNKPRLIKTHLAWSALPKQLRNGTKKPRIIYVMRNPKDTCISYYHHCKLLEQYSGDLDQFCELFLAGRLNNGPFWSHILGYWNRRHHQNILVIQYEDMKTDLESVVRKVARFLEVPISNEKVTQLLKHLNFESMKNNESVNFSYFLKQIRPEGLNKGEGFMRSGKIGSYKTEMSKEIVEKFDEWTFQNTKDTDLALAI